MVINLHKEDYMAFSQVAFKQIDILGSQGCKFQVRIFCERSELLWKSADDMLPFFFQYFPNRGKGSISPRVPIDMSMIFNVSLRPAWIQFLVAPGGCRKNTPKGDRNASCFRDLPSVRLFQLDWFPFYPRRARIKGTPFLLTKVTFGL